MTQKKQKPITLPARVFYCSKCGEQLRPSVVKKWFDVRSGDRYVNFIWKCPKRIFNWQGHTKFVTAEDGKLLVKDRISNLLNNL